MALERYWRDLSSGERITKKSGNSKSCSDCYKGGFL